MLNYIHLTLSNPGRPELLPVNCVALVVNESVPLGIPPALALELQLAPSGTRQVQIRGGATSDVPYAGPLQVGWKNRFSYAGALITGEQVIIGTALAQELELSDTAQAAPSKMITPPPIMAEKAFPVSPAAPAPPTHKPWEPGPDDHYPTDQIMIVKNFLDVDTCRALCDFARTQKKEQTGVIDMASSTDKGLVSKIDTKTRVAYRVAVKEIEAQLQRICYDAIVEKIEPYFNLQIERWEYPQVLYYTEGGRYGVHCDAENWHKNPDGTGYWKKIHDRDISLIIYLNDAFTGGGLWFPNQKLRLRPEPGMLVAFPSTRGYVHSVDNTESGERFVIVNWTKARHSEQVLFKIQNNVTFMDDYRKRLQA